jgi:TP901 family phage tail tape measure protein
MSGGVTKFSNTTASAVQRMDHKINGVFNSLNGMSQLAVGGGLSMLFYQGGKDIMDYETKLASLAAVTGTEIGAMNKQIESLGKTTGRSVIDIAGAFEIVGSKMSEYLDNPDALKKITDGSILLANASRMELEPAIESLTQLMNIYKMTANDTSKIVNKLSAGETVGSISIAQSGDILRQFGAQAVSTNVRIEESIALIQTLTKSLGVEGVGRNLRNILFDISSTKTWDKNRWKAIRMAGVDFEFVTNKANTLTDRLTELKKLSGVKGATELFFKRTGTIGAKTLFQNFWQNLYEV